MKKFKRILWATDFSEGSRHALEHAVAIAQKNACLLEMLHVNTPIVADGVHDFFAQFPVAKEIQSALEKSAQDHMNAVVVSKDIKIRRNVIVGMRAAGKILEFAQREEIDLIVIGSRGHGAFEKIFLGSVAQQVARGASCSVLVVPSAGEEKPGPASYAKILAPVDFSDASARGLLRAGTIAQEHHSVLDLLYVQSYHDAFSGMGYTPVTIDIEAMHEVAENRLSHFREKYAPNAQFSTVARGRPVSCIRDFAADQNVDLIVMAESGRGDVERTLLGTTVEGVIEDAPCSVLIVRNQSAENI